MKALVFNNIGVPKDVLQVMEVNKPEPKEGEIRIKLISSPINPADNLFISGQYRHKPQFPQIAGLEGTGIVEKIGGNVDIQLGTLVAFRHHNVWAEYVIVPIEKITVLPSDFPTDKASQFSLNPMTAYALIEESNVEQNDWILLTAGNSALSKLMIQFAQEKHINTIAVIRDKGDANLLLELGANKVLFSDSLTLREDILNITQDQGVNAILDAVGGELISRILRCMSSNSRLILYGLMSNENVNFHNSDIIFKNITIQGFGIDKWLSQIDNIALNKIKDLLISILSRPDFEMPVSSKWKMEDFIGAFEDNKSTKNGGKVLLSF